MVPKELSRSETRIRHELAVFLGLLAALTSLSYLAVTRVPESTAVALLMWSPGLAAILTLALCRRSIGGLGWQLGRPVYLAMGYLAPILYVSIPYTLLWLSGLTEIDMEAAQRITPVALLMFIPGTLGASITALGEELGWRGFLTPRLFPKFGLVGTSLITGGLWSIWHYPLLWVAPDLPSTPLYYQAACFTVMAVGMSFLMTFLRVTGKSVWPAVLLHASHNIWIQGFFDRLTVKSPSAEWWSGELGVALALTGVVVAVTTVALASRRSLMPD